MNNNFKHLPKDKRKKILLICDDLRVHSGVATVAKEIVVHTSHHFNWVQIAGSINHPEKGKRLDLSDGTNDLAGIKDSSVFLYPSDGYGNVQMIREIINFENPDAIFLITDPRYFMHVWNMEQEIRKKIPITYLNIWDDYPAPLYNRPYYEACDLLMGISKQTVNINKLVLKGHEGNRIFKYIPHGKDPKVYFPLDDNDLEFVNFKKSILGDKEPKFILYFNSRNIRRKQIPDAMLAFRAFLDSIPENEAKDCYMILKTEKITDAGTDLPKVKEYLFDESYQDNIIFVDSKLSEQQLNWLYNLADVTVLPSSNEGWGLALTESMMAGTMIIANVTGGMQDQMRFEDENGDWIKFDENFCSNHFGTYKKCGKWALPVFPSNTSVVGSPKTPYIFDDRLDFRDLADALMQSYKMSKEEKVERGLAGREWVTSDESMASARMMNKNVIKYLNKTIDNFKPRNNFEFIKIDKLRVKQLQHKLIY